MSKDVIENASINVIGADEIAKIINDFLGSEAGKKVLMNVLNKKQSDQAANEIDLQFLIQDARAVLEVLPEIGGLKIDQIEALTCLTKKRIEKALDYLQQEARIVDSVINAVYHENDNKYLVLKKPVKVGIDSARGEDQTVSHLIRQPSEQESREFFDQPLLERKAECEGCGRLIEPDSYCARYTEAILAGRAIVHGESLPLTPEEIAESARDAHLLASDIGFREKRSMRNYDRDAKLKADQKETIAERGNVTAQDVAKIAGKNSVAQTLADRESKRISAGGDLVGCQGEEALHSVMKTECPYCGAAEGQKCFNISESPDSFYPLAVHLHHARRLAGDQAIQDSKNYDFWLKNNSIDVVNPLLFDAVIKTASCVLCHASQNQPCKNLDNQLFKQGIQDFSVHSVRLFDYKQSQTRIESFAEVKPAEVIQRDANLIYQCEFCQKTLISCEHYYLAQSFEKDVSPISGLNSLDRQTELESFYRCLNVDFPDEGLENETPIQTAIRLFAELKDRRADTSKLSKFWHKEFKNEGRAGMRVVDGVIETLTKFRNAQIDAGSHSSNKNLYELVQEHLPEDLEKHGYTFPTLRALFAELKERRGNVAGEVLAKVSALVTKEFPADLTDADSDVLATLVNLFADLKELRKYNYRTAKGDQVHLIFAPDQIKLIAAILKLQVMQIETINGKLAPEISEPLRLAIATFDEADKAQKARLIDN